MTDIVVVVIICIIIALIVVFAWFRIKKSKSRRGDVVQEPIIQEPPLNEIFTLISRVKYPVTMAPPPGQAPDVATKPAESAPEQTPKKIELIKNRVNITESLEALAKKYFLLEITIATDDGLVLASSADHDVQPDAAKFSQILRRQMVPDEPGVTLFELYHNEAHLIGIIRTDKDLLQNWKKEIREDTKGILQWWL
jgi:hypothetical protein